jgi:hypothetical protein
VYQPNFMAGVKSIRVTMKRDRPARHLTAKWREVDANRVPGSSIEGRIHSIAAPRVRIAGMERVSSAVVSHPAGCPATAFCGCGAAVRVFGRPIRDLWLAANWLRFPRAAPAPGMVAARRGHVFVLESHIGGSTWLAWDANSGHHATRIHARSIAGFAIVNPHGGNA